MTRVVWLSPLPPSRTGIADYSALILPSLARRLDLIAATDQPFDPIDGVKIVPIDDLDPVSSDLFVAQMGNNLHHERIFRLAQSHDGPLVVVLHDIVLHHLIAEVTLARDDTDGYEAMLSAAEGARGAAFARARASGLHMEIGNFLLPASAHLANRADCVIVHNEWAAARLRELGVETTISVIDHPHAPARPVEADDGRLRARHGIPADARVVGVFGFVTAAKRPEVVFQAFARALKIDPRLHLIFVGQPASTVDLASIAQASSVEDQHWSTTGFASASDFDSFLSISDRVIALRYPSAGETSGALVQIFRQGIPVAVSDYAQFADYPEDTVVRIPLGDGEVDHLTRFLTSDLPATRQAQASWLESHGRLDAVVDRYVTIIDQVAQGIHEPRLATRPPLLQSIPLLPSIGAKVERIGNRVEVTVENLGTHPLSTVNWGLPWYGIEVEIRSGARRESFVEKMKGDLLPGDRYRFSHELRELDGPIEVRLSHYQDRLPSLDRTFHSTEIGT